MEQGYRTPEDLVEGLIERQPEARQALWSLLREPVSRLMRGLAARHNLGKDYEVFVVHALHAAETALRSRPARAQAGLTWEAFRAAQLLQVARSAVMPHGTGDLNGTAPSLPPIPDSPEYRSGAYFRPYSRIGGQFFGGDWYVGRCLDDGTLWVLLADVTGHGYFAYLLASALPSVWQRCWSALGDVTPEPAELLAVMHELICDSLPEGIFLEATLVRLSPSGEATVAAAGGTRLLHRSDDGPELVKLRGAWLGIRAPKAAEQHRLKLSEGDELVLATDGVFDQLDDEGGHDAIRKAWREGRSVFDVVRSLIERSLAHSAQKDDITLVTLEKQGGRPPGILKFPGRE
jgi:hypothetical protein